MGGTNTTGWGRKSAFGALAILALAACDENGSFSLPGASQADETTAQLPINAPNQIMTERDIERPDIFSVSDRGLWDGRPSLGGSWVAHPDVVDPERVVIRNVENGREITGALFRRERENPGPLLQVSSDAAEALGMLPGAPTDMDVVVLRREEVVEEGPATTENPVVGSLEAPVTVVAEPLEAQAADPEDGTGEAAAVAVVLPEALEAAAAAAQTTPDAAVATGAATVSAGAATAAVTEEAADVIDVSSVIAPVTPSADGPIAQIGVFSVQANADATAVQITQAGIGATVIPIDSGGRTVWQVTAGPLVDDSGVAQLQALGYLDAVIISQTDE